MASIALVSILCRDRVGLVSGIADCLFSAGINLRDTSFAVLGQGAEFTSVCELPSGITATELETELNHVPELDNAQVRVVPYGFDPQPGPKARITDWPRSSPRTTPTSSGSRRRSCRKARAAATSRGFPSGCRPSAPSSAWRPSTAPPAASASPAGRRRSRSVDRDGRGRLSEKKP
jgi:predicted amino acid-binding ACT domain protein